MYMVMAHHPDMKIQTVTKSVPFLDEEGHQIDHKAIWKDVGGYASRVAAMADVKTYHPAMLLPPSQEGESSSSEDDQDKSKISNISAEAVDGDH